VYANHTIFRQQSESENMLWLTLILATVVSVLALGYVVWPMLHPQEQAYAEDDPLAELLSQKDAALRSLAELEFDYRVGKIGEEDFQRFDSSLRRRTIGLMRQIEQYAPATDDLDQALEAAIARQRRVKEG
jgi:N-glycosylase/DNA lyase